MATVFTELPGRLAAKGLAAIAVLLCGCSATDKPSMKRFNEATLHVQNVAGVLMENEQPFTGIIYSLAPNEKDTTTVVSFVNGLEDGEWRKYFSNRKPMEKRFFEKGKKVGVYTAWWPNGKLRLLYHFSNGEYEGSCRDWNEEGVLVAEMNYKAGHEEGPQKQFYNNGRVRANYVIKDGRRFGLLGTKNCVNVSDSVFRKS